MNMVWMILFLVGGFALLVKGADIFVDGACGLSNRLKIPAFVIGLTVVAFGTSLPEAAVSITASIQGSNEIAIGNIIGSNIFNTLVVLGASALFAPAAVKQNFLKRDFPFCIGITVVMLILMVTYGNGQMALTRFDGIILLVFFTVFMIMSVVSGKKEAAQQTDADEIKPMSLTKCIILAVIGMAGVIVGGQLTVEGAKSLARVAGLSEKVIGLTVVAIGTSLPELVTSIVAAKKNQNDIAVGNVIGSNIFNILFILGVSSVIGTIATDIYSVIDCAVLIAVVAVTYLFALKRKSIGRAEGVIMIIAYAAYTAYLLIR